MPRCVPDTPAMGPLVAMPGKSDGEEVKDSQQQEARIEDEPSTKVRKTAEVPGKAEGKCGQATSAAGQGRLGIAIEPSCPLS